MRESIGIIAAMDDEMMAIKEIMKNVNENEIYDLKFIEVEISDKNCILVKCGIGKVNAARTTQILIDNYNVSNIINVGSACGINLELNIGDIVIADNLVQYDFDITGFGKYEKGEISGIGKYIKSDKRLVELFKDIIKYEDKEFNIKIGTIASADLFFTESEKAYEIRKEFNAECVEMEGAAIAQVCLLDKIPFLVIRGISDVANGNNRIDFITYLKRISKIVAELLENLIRKL